MQCLSRYEWLAFARIARLYATPITLSSDARLNAMHGMSVGADTAVHPPPAAHTCLHACVRARQCSADRLGLGVGGAAVPH
eukprot:365159-Chlamydomonas_euryale.AAC.12